MLKTIVMRTDLPTDVSTLAIHLNELKSNFHRAIKTSENINTLRELHEEIKELECYLTAMQWNRSSDVPRQTY